MKMSPNFAPDDYLNSDETLDKMDFAPEEQNEGEGAGALNKADDA